MFLDLFYIFEHKKIWKDSFWRSSRLFLTFSLYLRIYHRSCEKQLQNSGFSMERTSFFSSKVFSRAHWHFEAKKKLSKKVDGSSWIHPTIFFKIQDEWEKTLLTPKRKELARSNLLHSKEDPGRCWKLTKNKYSFLF
jgi:hypothetical protein